MYYRPQEKKRSPTFTIISLLVLIFSLGVLALFVGIYIGYFDVETTVLADRFSPTPTPTRPAALYVGDADQFLAEGKIQAAIDSYGKAIKIDPSLDVPYARQSRLLIYTRDTAGAVEQAEQAVLLNPTSAENMALYCRALDWEARYGEALDACSCAIELDPAYAEGYAFLSEVYADQGEWLSARTTAQQAIDTNYQSMHAHHNMGYALEVQGRYAEAVEFYKNAGRLAPQLGPIQVDVGRSYYWLGNYEMAETHFKQAIRLNPTDPDAYNWLGWTYYTNGSYAQAIDALEQSLSVDAGYISSRRGTSAWGNLATVYYTRQNFEEAIALLPKAIELAESQFARRVRQVEIYTTVETLTGSESIPVLRGELKAVTNRSQNSDSAILKPINYQTSDITEVELSCSQAIVRSINNKIPLIGSTQSLTTTAAFSKTTGSATLDLSTGILSLALENLPQPEAQDYEIKVTFWPNRTDSIGFMKPDTNGQVNINIQFEEKILAPIEYYYTLGLAYAYLDPPQCDEATPWLLRSLEIDNSGGNPAWAGLRICPTSDTPATPTPPPSTIDEG